MKFTVCDRKITIGKLKTTKIIEKIKPETFHKLK